MTVFSLYRACRPVFAAGAVLLGSLVLVSTVAAEETADQAMARAHAGRAVWTNFPGFTADLTLATPGCSTKGTLKVSAAGDVTLELADPQGMEWATRTLESIVSHRLADDGAIAKLEFADNDRQHPLGRLLKSQSETDKNLWRVQGDVLTEVQRFMPKTRFIISVMDVSRNKEGKHVPRSYNVTTWNRETGAIESARQVYNEWTRIGEYDLPIRLLAANSKPDGTRQVEEIVLSNHRLTSAVAGKVSVIELAPLKAPVTSFGAAIADGHLYVYGGHLGATHKYSSDQQSKQLLRLDLSKKDASWEVVGSGPGRTGLSMVAYDGRLYRIGGWEAKNAAGEDAKLHSSRDFARFDPKSGQWQDLAPLPEGRSSHDAAVLGSHLYLIGGWDMQGGDGDYHTTAYVCDLAQANPQWTAIAKPPFSRRALAVAAWQGKIYVIGGMDDANDTTTATNILDPQSQQWSDGPALPGKPMDGFSPSAFGTAGGLFATTRAGLLVRLSNDGKSWQEVGKLNHPRIAHRLLAAENGTLVAVGGAARGGKVREVEAIQVTVAAK